MTLKDLDEGKTYKLDHLSPTEPIVIEIPKRRNKFQLHFQSGSSETRIKNAYLVVKSKQEDPKCIEKKPKSFKRYALQPEVLSCQQAIQSDRF